MLTKPKQKSHNANANNNSYNNNNNNHMSAQPKFDRYNFIVNSTMYNNNNNSNHKQNIKNKHNADQHSALEQSEKQSVHFNTAQEFEYNGCDVAVPTEKYPLDTRYECNNCKRITTPEHVYENLQAYELSLSKEFLLEKYFRSEARTQAIYQNLCRGCGYGVFASQGDLCNFCECIVNGVVKSRGGAGDSLSEKLNANIYENICEQCGRLYSSAECVCQASELLGSTPLISDLDAEQKQSKLRKSKSFGKRDKRSIFHGLFDTLRGGQSAQKSAGNRTLEIVHHVDGHENVFRTQETFDLQRICELKRTQKSCSEQHIYGRLKANEGRFAAQASQEQGAQTLPTPRQPPLLTQKQQKSGKRPRISKPSLLRTKSQNDAFDTLPRCGQQLQATPSNQSLYLNESICQWMSALRQQIHSYEADSLTAPCHPKSIPSRGNLFAIAKTTAAPSDRLTNTENIDKLTVRNVAQRVTSNADATCNSDVASVTNDKQQQQQQQEVDVVVCQQLAKQQGGESVEAAEEFENEQQVAIEHMISEFKRQLIAKQMHKQQQQHKPATKQQLLLSNNNNNNSNSNKMTLAGNSNITLNAGLHNKQAAASKSTTLTAGNNITLNGNSNSNSNSNSVALTEKQANVRATALSNLRSKRQAIYLKNLDITTATTTNNNNAKATETITAEETNSQLTAAENSAESLAETESRAAAIVAANSMSNNSIAKTDNNKSVTNNNNSNNNKNVSNNCLTAGTANVGDLAQLVSRRAIHEVINTVASSQRYGIYERDTEFVSEILKAFDTFLRIDNNTNGLSADTCADADNDSDAAALSANRNRSDNESDNESVSAREGVKLTEISEGNADELLDKENSADKRNKSERRTTAAGVPVSVSAVASDAHVAADNVNGIKAITLISSSRPGNDSAGSFVVPTAADGNTCSDSCELLVTTTTTETATALTTIAASKEFSQIFDLYALINRQLLSFSLNRCVLSYDKCLSVFLNARNNNNNHKNGMLSTAHYQQRRQHNSAQHYSRAQLIKIFHKFYAYYQGNILKQNNNNKIDTNNFNCNLKSAKTPESVPIRLESARVCVERSGERKLNGEINESNNNKVFSENCVTAEIVTTKTASATKRSENLTGAVCITATDNAKQRPKVPQRDPKTALSANSSKQLTPPLPAKKLESQAQLAQNMKKPNMTVPKSTTTTNQNNNNTTNNTAAAAAISNTTTTTATMAVEAVEEEECIYQPIWQFKTVGEAQERYETDADYYDDDDDDQQHTITKAAVKSLHLTDAADAANAGNDSSLYDIEDHGEWETDDEFMFTTHTQAQSLRRARRRSCSNEPSGTIRSTHSASSASGSTVTGFGSSTATLSSVVSVSLKHPMLRSIGIFYSLTEPKLRAIVYDYERNHASQYFVRATVATLSHYTSSGELHAQSNDSGLGKSPGKQQYSPVPPPRTTSSAKSAACHQPVRSESATNAHSKTTAPTEFPLLPDSVLAWQFMLLDVNYLEDEEDMIVSESEILRAQEIKDDIDTRQTQQLNILQRFKSASIGNLIDLPNDDDKKSLKERMRNKFQRGVLKLNVRSPKSDKKNRGIFRRAEATSLYLEDGMKPKYPIFGAPLEQLELNRTTQPHVPKFVVDCIEYIERPDCIEQDGLYRASGNKVSVDELKQKLSESYIYDPKLLITDDIHTLTSLLKQFFRELGAPLIPQDVYKRLAHNLNDPASIEQMRIAFDEMHEPNRSTLKFLIRHLTNVAAHSSANRMPASNLAIVWGPCLLSANQIEFDIGRMNTLAKVLIENYARIFAANDNERLVS